MQCSFGNVEGSHAFCNVTDSEQSTGVRQTSIIEMGPESGFGVRGKSESRREALRMDTVQQLYHFGVQPLACTPKPELPQVADLTQLLIASRVQFRVLCAYIIGKVSKDAYS